MGDARLCGGLVSGLELQYEAEKEKLVLYQLYSSLVSIGSRRLDTVQRLCEVTYDM